MAETDRPPQNACADLLTRLQEDAALEMAGTPALRERRGRKYWYTVQRYAANTVETYLGPDTKEVRERVERIKAINEDLKRRSKRRTGLVRLCREGGLPSVDGKTGKVLMALSKAGAFRLGAVVVGTQAYRCYPGLLGIRLAEAVEPTGGIDGASLRSIALALDDPFDPELAEALGRIGPFDARSDRSEHATAWRDRGSGIAVALLAPDDAPDRDEPLELPAPGAFARSLRFLDYLIHEPVQAVILYRSGVLITVPQPARYAIHKLIVATRRETGAQARAAKDIPQAARLIQILAEDRPDELEAAYVDACRRGPAWRRQIDLGLRRLPPEAREALGGAIL